MKICCRQTKTLMILNVWFGDQVHDLLCLFLSFSPKLLALVWYYSPLTWLFCRFSRPGGDEWEFPDEMIDKDKFNENLADTMVVAKGKLASSESGSAPAPKQKCFMNRPVYLALKDEGLVSLPPVQGFFLSCHPSSCQWHAGFPKADGTGVKNRAPKWSESVRSERKALLLALRFLWETYVSDGNSDGQHHVDQLNAALAS